jgi:hypothetical protein
MSNKLYSGGAILFYGVVRIKDKSDMLARRQGRIDKRNSIPIDGGGQG